MSKVGSQLLASILVNAIYEMKNYPIILINTVISSPSLSSSSRQPGSSPGSGHHRRPHHDHVPGWDLPAVRPLPSQERLLPRRWWWPPHQAGVYVAGIAISERSTLPGHHHPVHAVRPLRAHHAINVLGIIAVLLLMFLTSIALGFALATVTTDIVQSFAFSRLITTLFSTLAPVYYPITLLPEPVRTLAYLSPTTYAAQLSHGLAGYQQLSTDIAVMDWGVLLGITAVCMWVGLRKARWRER